MADLVSYTQTAAVGDRLTSDWANSVRNAINSANTAIAANTQSINQLRADTTQAFKTSVLSGLTVSYLGGNVALTSGVIIAISPGTATVPNNATSYLFINALGAVTVDSSLPQGAVGMAAIVASGGVITSLQNYPLFAIRPSFDPGAYATTTYAASRAWEKAAVARKNSLQNLANNAQYYIVTFESLQGAGFATNGTFTHTGVQRDYIFDAQIRIDTTAPNSANLSVKVSIFVNGTEQAILYQARSAEGDITGTGRNVEPFRLSDGDQVNIRAYVTSGVNVRVRENYSVCVAWRLPQG